MIQSSEKQSPSRLSPLFVDTEFVPTGFSFFTIYHRKVSEIPGVLPYQPGQTFQHLQYKLTSSKLPSSSFTSSIKEYKIQTHRKHINGDELELGPDRIILQPRGRSENDESKDRCEICCVMLASHNEVLRLQIQRRQEKHIQEQILAELNFRYKCRLNMNDIRFNSISFSINTNPDLPNSIIYDSQPATRLTELILGNDRITFIGIEIVTNRVSMSIFVNQENQVVSAIDVDSEHLLRITDLNGKKIMLEFEKIKQYRVEEILEILGVENARTKGLKVIEKIFKPSELIYNIAYLYKASTLLNFLEAVIVDQSQVFIQNIKSVTLLNQSEFSNLTKNYGTIYQRLSIVGLFCSDFELQVKNGFFRWSYHTINKYIRNYFTHTYNYIHESVFSRLTKALYFELDKYPNFPGKVYRKVNFELTHQKNDIIDFSGFIVTTANQQLLSLNNPPIYTTRSTIVNIISKTGKKVGGDSFFSNLQEVIFLPFTKFKVIERTQIGNNIYLTLQQCTIEKKQAINHIILWLQQKGYESKTIFQKQLQYLPFSIRLFRLEDNLELFGWIGKNQRYVESESTNIIVITNMFRIQNGRENPKAGAQTIVEGRKQLPRAKYILYIGNIENAMKILASSKLNPDQLHVTNDPNDLVGYLCSQFNATLKKKKVPPPQTYRLPRQDWLDFFPQLHSQKQPLNNQEFEKTKQKEKEKKQYFGIKNNKSPEKEKGSFPPVYQEKKYDYEVYPENNPVKSPKAFNAKKQFPVADFGQQYKNQVQNEPKKVQFYQPTKPMSAINEPPEEQDLADRFNLPKGLTVTQSQGQSNLYKLNNGILTSKIGSSIMPGASSKFGQP